MAQINFGTEFPAYAVGRRANAEEWNTVTYTAGGAVGFGVPVMPGSADGTAVELDGTNSRNVLGITEASVVLPHPGDAYAQGDNMGVCESGVIGVKVGASGATKGAAARWDVSNKVWTTGAQSATVVTVPGAEFDEAAAANSVGVIRYRRPVPSVSVSGASGG